MKPIQDLLKQMTLDEKIMMTTGGLPYGMQKNSRLGIPHALLNDSMAGINFRQLFADFTSMETGENILQSLRRCEKILQQMREYHEIHPSELNEEELVAYEAIRKHLDGDITKIYHVTSFPAGILLGATWNPEVVFQCAEALSREFSAFGIDVLLTPNLNIQRDPLGGRSFEGYSEDPLVTSEMGVAFVKGIEESGILATPKHFAVNNHEKERKGINVHVPERALHEIYFPGFKACVKQGKVQIMMSAYNKINGTACSENYRLLTELLREEWGFEGFVMSDWGGVYDPVKAIRAGNDLEMPQVDDRKQIKNAIETGSLSEEELDQTVLRLLKVIEKMPCIRGRKYQILDEVYSRKAAYEAVAEGIVLLKNEGVLPLNGHSFVNLQGNGVHNLLESGSGSSEVLRKKPKSLYECMEEKLGREHVFDNAAMGNTKEDVVIVVGRARGQEGIDRPNMLLDAEDQRTVQNTLRKAKELGKKTILVLNVSGPVDMREYEHNADAILTIFIPGCMGYEVLTDLILGEINPSGKLAVTFPEKYEDCPTFGNFPGYNAEVWYGEGIYVGYRYYDTKMIEPKYPFGYGLSYTDFSIHSLQLEKQTVEDEMVNFSVQVTNIGRVKGKEVVQVYIRHYNPFLQKPCKELKAFQKVEVNPGETQTVRFQLEKEKFTSYDEKLKRFILEPGVYEILVGNSSRHIFERANILWKGEDPYGYNEMTRIATVFGDERCRVLYQKYFEDKCSIKMYNDLLGYTPDYPVGKAIRERVPVESYQSREEKEASITEFFRELSKIDLGKLKLSESDKGV